MLQYAVAQQVPQQVVQQSPQQQVVQQIPQTEGVARVITVGAFGEVGGRMATGAIPKPSNPYYIPRVDNPERILSSTPPGQAG